MKETSGVPRTQSRMWSQAELAADNALESFLALIIAAPRCWTVVMNSPCNLRNEVTIPVKTKIVEYRLELTHDYGIHERKPPSHGLESEFDFYFLVCPNFSHFQIFI